MKPSTTKDQHSGQKAATPAPAARVVEPPVKVAPTEPPVADPSDAALASTAGAPSAERLGHVQAMRHRFSVGDVQAFLGDAWDRVEALKGASSTLRLLDRLRASDGQIPPIVFTKDGDNAPCIFSGYETIAAHVLCGHLEIDALIIDAADASEAQTIVSSMIEKPKSINPFDEPASRFAAR